MAGITAVALVALLCRFVVVAAAAAVWPMTRMEGRRVVKIGINGKGHFAIMIMCDSAQRVAFVGP